MEMVNRILVSAAIATSAVSASAAADFSLTIGSPFAATTPGANAPVVKKVAALFAVRMENCPMPERALITGGAEGVVDGERVTAPVAISPAGSPGVYLVSPTWNQPQGVWVVNLSASCASAKAGALVPVGPQGFLRDKTKLLPRAATRAEIDATLKTLIP